ncbi:MAG TPA: hypothetical protein VFA83_07140 [Acidimicrobiales bacterium]|nr:hypothetical protein [Acidimicrobiales bacterium]
MGRITTRIVRGLAAATVAATAASTLTATAAHADAHWQIDRDHVVLGASSSNSFKAFDGYVESYYDGTSPIVRGELTGPFVGRGTVKVTWTYHDGSTSTQSDYTAGVQHNIDFVSSSSKSVVKFNFTYTPNSGSADSQTNYVGDSPDSVGSCTRLDQNQDNVSQSGYGSFTGSVWFGCTNDGHVYAQTSGTSSWANDSAVRNRAEFVFWYTDGTVEVRTSPTLSSTNSSATVGATSDQSKSITWAGVRLVRWVNGRLDTTMPHQDVKFGKDL